MATIITNRDGSIQLVPGSIIPQDLSTQVLQGIIPPGIEQIGNSQFDATFYAAETLSGEGNPLPIAVTQSPGLSGLNTAQVAMASVSGRMPAIGFVIHNYVSGQKIDTIISQGLLFSSGFNFSGWLNNPVYVAASGYCVASGAPNSSGNVQQIVGTSIQNSGMYIRIGDPLEPVVAQSGDIGSGAVTGQGIGSGGYFGIASGTISNLDCISGYSSSWNSDYYTAGELISGFRAVCYLSGGASIGNAQASSGQRLPSIGVAAGNVASGSVIQVFYGGPVTIPASGLDTTWSGMAGKLLYVGSGGLVVTASGLTSGASYQKLGVAYSGGINIRIDMSVFSGAVSSPAGNF